jgi:hypothetical protein
LTRRAAGASTVFVKHKLGNNLHTARMHARHAADT